MHGIDLWLGNPLRPMEASSTSGMKAVLNGSLHVSTLDGWWDEAWTPETGWAIGDREISDNQDYQDQKDAESLYRLLEREIIPRFYNRNSEDIPRDWVTMIKNSIKAFVPFFNTHRMVQEYATKFYIPAIQSLEKMEANGFSRLKSFDQWKKHIFANWGCVTIERIEDNPGGNILVVGGALTVKALLFLGKLKPKDIIVEVFYGVVDADGKVPEGDNKILEDYQELGEGEYLYSGSISCERSGCFGYNLRVFPSNEQLIGAGRHLHGMMSWG